MTAISTSLELTVTVTAHQGRMQWRQINTQSNNVYSGIFLLKRERRAHSSRDFIKKNANLPKWPVELTQLLPILFSAHIWRYGDVNFKSWWRDMWHWHMLCWAGVACVGA